MLRMENIQKFYGRLCANDHVNLSLGEGEVLAVIGENGAGKTTLMKVLYGLEQPSAGRILLNDAEVHFRGPSDAVKAGIGMVQQHFMLFDSFTAAENIVYGKEPKKGLFFSLERADRDIAKLSERYALPLDPGRKIVGMPVGLRQRVEILKVLYRNSKIIVFDEPTAVLTPQEAGELIKTIKTLAAAGKSIILITHKLREVMTAADRVMVMREGKLIDDVPTADTSIEEISFKMVGRRPADKTPAYSAGGDAVLQVRDLCRGAKDAARRLDNVSIHVNAGEIVGIAGVSGNGQAELIDTVFGLKRCSGDVSDDVSGDILINGKSIFSASVAEVRDSGIALIPEDRFLRGSAEEASLSESAVMGHHRKKDFSRRGMLNYKRAKVFTGSLIDDFSIKAGDTDQKTGSLSGGNVQKMVVAREMAQHTPLLLACEPTRGIDIGAMELIHEKLTTKRDNGGSVLLVSSELSEIIKLSDRIYVMFEGRIQGEFQRGRVGEEELGFLMAGGASPS